MGLFDGLHGQTVTIEPINAPYPSTGFGGQQTYGTAVTYAARVERKQRRVVTADGEERTSQGRVIIEGFITVTLKSRLTIVTPGSPLLTPTVCEIMMVEQVPGAFGQLDATVLWF